MKKMEARTLRIKSCGAKDGVGDDDESLNKSNFSLHSCPLIFQKQQKTHSQKTKLINIFLNTSVLMYIK